MTERTACIIGATASLGVALCRVLAAQGWALTLVGRDNSALQQQAKDCQNRHGVKTRIVLCDFSPDSAMNVTETAAQIGQCDALFMLSGIMDATLEHMLHVNVAAPMALVEACADTMEEGSAIAIVSSVAGDRGRASNYHYGCSKAALSAYASGLRNRLHKHGVHVMTVKPGFVDTPMTWGMQSPLIASRDDVAESIVRAMSKRKHVIYVPWFWRIIMGIILHIPEVIFKRLSL